MRNLLDVILRIVWPVLRWILLGLLIVLILGSILGLFDSIERAGLGKKTYTETTWTRTNSYGITETVSEKVEPAKTLWDWLDLLIIPVVLALGALWFNAQNQQTEREIASDRNQEAALQAYLDRMTELLLKEGLRTPKPEDKVRTVARIRTLTVLKGLKAFRKSVVMVFLVEAGLVSAELSEDGYTEPIVSLVGVDLNETNLYLADLEGAALALAGLRNAQLGDANLRGANLRGADLEGASLKEAELRGAHLEGANLKRATLPDGSKWTEGTDMSRFTNPPSDAVEPTKPPTD